MIADSLKRRHSGWDEPEQPPKKILCVHNKRQNRDPGNSRIVSKKRPLSVEDSETGTENTVSLDSKWIHLKRRRIKQETRSRDADGDTDTMQIKGSAQYHQSPAKTGKGKSKRSKKNRNHKGAANAHPQTAEPEKVDQAFNDMLFWRPVLPDIEAELTKFFEDSMEISESSTTTTSSSEDEEESFDEYSSFNFWRVPICDVDLSAIH